MQKKFRRNIKSLETIFAFIGEFINKNDIDDSLNFVVNLVIEELFTNMVKYSSATGKEVLIGLDKTNGDLIITLTDFGVAAFDITKAKAVDVEEQLEQRKPGGLGLHLVKQMMDDINYEYIDKNSKITLIKHLEM